MTDQSKNYVVVGGGSGIGLDLVSRLSAGGNHVSVLSRTGHAREENRRVQQLTLDVISDEIDPSLLPSEIHGLAYCVGSINLAPLRRLKSEDLVSDFQLNVVGAVNVLQAALTGMRAAKSSSMVLFSTVAVGQGMPMHCSVAAAKGAVEGLTRSLAAELAPKIRVNCIAPSLTETPLAERLIATDNQRQAMAARHPLKRFGQPEDIGSIAEFLMSDHSSWITGQVIGVDGGLSTLRV